MSLEKEFRELKNIVQQQVIELEKQRKIIKILQKRLNDLADDFDRKDDSYFNCYRRTEGWRIS